MLKKNLHCFGGGSGNLPVTRCRQRGLLDVVVNTSMGATQKRVGASWALHRFDSDNPTNQNQTIMKDLFLYLCLFAMYFAVICEDYPLLIFASFPPLLEGLRGCYGKRKK